MASGTGEEIGGGRQISGDGLRVYSKLIRRCGHQ